MADEEIILRVEADTAGAVQSVEALTTAIEETTAANKQLQEDQKALGKRTEENSDEWDKNAAAIALNRSEVQQLNQQRKNAINVTKNEVGTLNQLRASLNTLKQQRNANLIEGSKAFIQANKEIQSLNDQVKAAEQAGGDFQRQVGDYKQATDGFKQSIDNLGKAVGDLKTKQNALDISTAKGKEEFKQINTQINVYNTQIKNVQDNTQKTTNTFNDFSSSLSEVSPALGGAVAGLQRMTKAALAFIATPLGAVLALIALALQSVAVFFKRSAEGQEELAKSTARLTSFFETFLDIVSAIGKFLFSIFIPLIKTVVDLFVAQFHAVQALARLLKGDFSGALESSKAVMNDLESAFNNLGDGVNAAIDNFGELTTSINESVQAAESKSIASQQLAADEFRLAEAIIKNTVAEAERTKQIAKLILASKDETTSIEERTAALDEANELELKSLKDSEAILAEQLRITKTKDAQFLSTIEGLQEVATAEAALLQFQTQSFNRQRNLVNRSNTLIKEQETLRKKNEAERVKRQTQQEKDRETRIKAEEKEAKLQAAKLQKEADLQNQILQIKKQREIEAATTNEARIDREIELEDIKFEHLLNNTELSAQQIEVITLNHQNALAAINQNGADQIAAIELKAFNQREALRKQDEARDKQSKQNFISLTAQVFSEASDLARDNAVASKLFAGAAASINTLQAITKTLAVGGAFAIPSALAVGALGFAQVAKIASTSVDAPTTTPGGSGLSGIARPINVDTGGLDRGISDNQILQNALEGITAQISITELNRVQNKVAVSERDSRLG